MFKQPDLEKICAALERQQYFIGDEIFPIELGENLAKSARKQSPQFTEAGIGRNGNHRVNSATRSDRTMWITGEDEIEEAYLLQMDSLKNALNRYFFLGLKRHEAHYSCYERGASYGRHIDAFAGKSNRIITTLLYLNNDWKTADGGELILYDDTTELEKISPTFGKFVVFLSDKFPHEVLVANRERFAISGWFRNDV